jgi:hypothetical protein
MGRISPKRIATVPNWIATVPNWMDDPDMLQSVGQAGPRRATRHGRPAEPMG